MSNLRKSWSSLLLWSDKIVHAVEVQDNGPGIPADLRSAIFDPFFTTKPVGRGTGLGLAISHKIAEEHGGTLTLCDTAVEGAAFCLELPLAEGGA